MENSLGYEKGLVSVIVPTYNGQNTILKCIESILCQTYENLEIIIIDDGSTDDTALICRNILKKDNRIKFIFKENSGVSDSRNRGISLSRGEFIQFVDCDDYIDKNMIEVLMNSITKFEADVVVCGYRRVGGTSVELKPCISKVYNSILELEPDFNKILNLHLFNSPVNKLYRKKCIKSLFPENVSLGEDLIFNLNYFARCKKMVFIDQCLYNYLVYQSNSLNVRFNSDTFKNIVIVYDELKKFCATYFVDPKCTQIADKEFATMFYYLMKKVSICPNFSKKEKINYIKSYCSSKYVKTIDFNICIPDKQVKFIWTLSKINASFLIYGFFRGKQKLKIRSIKNEN